MQDIVTELSYSRSFQGFFFSGIEGTKRQKTQKVQGDLKTMQRALDRLSGCFFTLSKVANQKVQSTGLNLRLERPENS